jgi:hypothetical protein
MSITTETPDSLEPEIDKPLVLPNVGYPFILIDHRRFERLCYWIYRFEIGSGEWKDRFDEIRLMSGVSDGGKDSALYKKKALVGIIQCKHSEKNTALSVPIFAKEVIKFSLYCQTGLVVVDSIFTYYIASSSGFNDACLTLIRDFKIELTKDLKFPQWTKSIIKGSAALKHLDYDKIESNLKTFIENLQIEKIDQEELNRILNKPNQQQTVAAFFEGKPVIDTKSIEPLAKDIKNLISKVEENRPAPITPEKIEQVFEDASIFLKDWISHIHDIRRIHFERSEVNSVMSWIQNPLGDKEKPICVVSGDGGNGKTVVMKDVYEKLTSLSIPVLGIKCDSYYSNDIDGLEKVMGLPASIADMVETLKTKHSLVVVLIDQIDALSQSLSSNRKPLNAYLLLIKKLIRIGGLRIIVSSRTYDLTYDPNLTTLKSNKVIEVNQLSENDVNSILHDLSIPNQTLGPAILQILRTPNNLKVFCSVYSPAVQLEGIRSIHDLYQEFWKQKIIQSQESEKCIKCLFAIADEMNKNQQIVVSRQKFETDHHAQISYLLSNGILIEHSKFIQFFHQTFYDFVYALSFVNGDGNLFNYVIANHQTLHIRSSVKMILFYLRSSDEPEYIRSLERLLLSNKIRFHIKLLVINSLGYFQNPIAAEFNFVKTSILSNEELKQPFLESALGKSWIEFLIKEEVINDLIKIKNTFLDKLLNKNFPGKAFTMDLFKERFGYINYETRVNEGVNLLTSILTKSLPEGRKIVAKYLIQEQSFFGKDWVVSRFLFLVKQWDCQELFDLFEKFHDQIDKNTTVYCHLLENIAPQQIDYTIEKFKKKILSPLADQDKVLVDHQLIKVFKRISEINSEKAFDVGVDLIRKLSQKSGYGIGPDRDDLHEDLTFWMYDNEKETHHGEQNLYSEVIGLAEEFSKREHKKFKEFIGKAGTENSIAILKILVYAFHANPIPFSKEIVSFVVFFNEKTGLKKDGKIEYWIRKLIGKIYERLIPDQKAILNRIILGIKAPREFEIYTDNGKKKYYLSYYGYSKYTYLSSIPESEVLKQPQLRVVFQELQRKFKKVADREPNKLYVGPVGAPLKVNAYESMTFDQWEKSFLKYNSEDRYSIGPSLLEHSRAFNNIVKKNPAKFFPFVEKLITENSVKQDYWIKGLEGLKEAAYQPQQLLSLFKLATKHTLNRENTLYLVWLTEIFINHQVADAGVIDFLVEHALHHEDPKEQHYKNTLMDGINSVRGSAIQRLLHCTYDDKFKEIIFVACEAAASDPVISVRASLVSKLARLLQFDKNRTINLYLKATETANAELVNASIESLKYLVHHNFGAMLPRIKQWILFDSVQEDLGAIVTWCWIKNYKGSKQVLNRIFRKSSKARAIAIRIGYENFHNTSVRRKCKIVLERFLTDKSKHVAHQYNVMYLHIKKASYNDWLPFLYKYSKSSIARKNPQYFLEYLVNNSTEYPIQCLDILDNLKSLPRPDISNGPYYQDEPLKIVLNSYNILVNSENKEYLKKSIEIFDRMLKIDFLRQQANSALHLVEQ